MVRYTSELIFPNTNANYNRDVFGTILFNVKAYGAKGNGIADDTQAIQKTITAAATNGGGVVFFPTGTYVIGQALTVTSDNVVFEGTGKASRIVTNSTTDDLVRLGDGINEIRNITFRDLCFDTNVTKTSGWAINSRIGVRLRIEDIWITAPENTFPVPRMLNGIYFDRFDYCRVESVYINISGIGIQARGNANQSYGAGLFIGGGSKIYAASSNGVANSRGVHLGGACGGVIFSDIDIIDCEIGVLISNTLQPGVGNREVFFSELCTLDSSGYSNVVLLSNSIVHLDMTGTWIASAGMANPDGVGIQIEPTQLSGFVIKLTGCRFFNNLGGGFSQNGGSCVITGCLFKDNGHGLNGGHGINIANAAVTDFSITGNEIISNGTATKGYGIIVQSASSVNYVITGNNVRNNAQGQISESGSNKVVANNLIT